ncbi:hypothetical protein HELRODRAFT_165800 [Helobdella robusta]|uniref:VWFD domain-containing protein n=1 Tax=Helobdella robusta TaxID=6412 RepID=T1EXA9_HELRO|nr:hypothetical protein HELRODRAFT_165800 [Helobdella robusta]ESN91733.1 hypothetical protein HELRODRAFT_165800 [Helobdella robusta]
MSGFKFTCHTGSFQTGISAVVNSVFQHKKYDGVVYENIWTNYTFPLITADRYDSFYGPAVCTSSGDPRVVTFDGTYYSIYQSGQFVYVKSDDRSVEVHVRHRPCVSNVACVCGVAIREGAVILAADMCTDSFLRYLVYPSTTLPSGYLVQRTSSGDSFELNTPSGKIFGSNAGNMLNIQIFIPSQYRASVDGLCGNYDGKAENDLHYKNKTLIPTRNDLNYVASRDYVDLWRLDHFCDETLVGLMTPKNEPHS